MYYKDPYYKRLTARGKYRIKCGRMKKKREALDDLCDNKTPKNRLKDR